MSAAPAAINTACDKVCASFLVKHFIARFGAHNDRDIHAITPSALKMLIDYHWPGNVRQLENTIERAVALSSGTSGTIDVEDIHLDTAKAGTRRLQGMRFFPKA
jgi:DNA-binding NtrC family response regulator